jgi:NAD(P)H-dependent FMN reductase
MKPTIVTFAGSARRDSLNKELARSVALAADSQGAVGVFIDLADYPLPICDGDLEASRGIPANALALAELIRKADGLVIASPEYNGAYSALLKNTIDWLSRIDRNLLSRPVAIASASPGRKGGSNGLKQLRVTLEHMRVPVIPQQLSIPTADIALGKPGGVDAEAAEEIRSIVASLIRQTHGVAV